MYKKFYIFLVIMLVASLVTSINYIIINYKEDKEQNEVFSNFAKIVYIHFLQNLRSLPG